MAPVTHLKALQALDTALETGSLRAAGERLGITAAAVGQRIRSLEDFLGTELLLRGRTGLRPTRELQSALSDLRTGFAALERVTDTLDFQRTTEIHIVAEPDWAELWLLPRLPDFRAAHPNILFCINGEGDVPVRLGAADVHIDKDPKPETDQKTATALYTDLLLPVGSPDVANRLEGLEPDTCLEGFPLLHISLRDGQPVDLGWSDWVDRWGHRQSGVERGVRYLNMRLALDGVRSNVGFLLCRASYILDALKAGEIKLGLPAKEHLPSPEPYWLRVRPDARQRPQVIRFLDWLEDQAIDTARALDALL